MKSAALIFGMLLLVLCARSFAEDKVDCFGVYEATITSDEKFENPFTEAQVRAKFTGPDQKSVELDGFYFQENQWKARFVPGKPGAWTYTLELKGKGEPKSVSGSFECVASKSHGFVRISKRNPYRFEYDDGTPFYPIGQQVGWGIGPTPGFDAEDDGQWKKTDRETFMKAFTGATNLMRSQLGCGTSAGVALQILTGKDGVDRYDFENSAKLDESCKTLKQYGWAQIMIPFQDMSLWGDGKTAFGSVRDLTTYKTLASPHLPAIDRYLRYVVARWSAYVDVWELYNEDSYSPSDYLAHLAKVVREADPYAHPIMTNYERPTEPWCEIISVHEYMGNPANEVPGHLSKEFARLKSYNKPVLYTEFGNQASLGNVDDVKWRVAYWTAFMNECGLGVWNMSGRRVKPKDKGGPVNTWLGPESRKAFQVLADFSRDLPVTMRPITPGFTSEQPVQSWALGDGKTAVLYVHHFRSHEQPVKLKDPLQVWTGAGKFHVKWIEPATGKVLGEEDLSTEQQILKVPVPEFTIDVAARMDRVETEEKK